MTMDLDFGDAGRREGAGLAGRLWPRLLAGLLARMERGRIRVTLPDGRVLEGGGGGETAEVAIRDWRALRRLALGGEIGVARSFLDSEWTTPDLLAVFRVIQANRTALHDALQGSALSRVVNLLAHRRRRNSRRGSRRNIAEHYDLGNDFYARWLDPSMTYSAALYADGANSLERAQEAKYRAIAELADLRPGCRVLEIGCGWGGFAAFAAREYGATVEGVTLSTEQLEWARRRAAEGGFADRASFHLTDYRETGGTYDRVVSIEMFEAVGEEHWPAFFRTVRERLKPGGRAVVQSITIDEAAFESYRRRADFIQRFVFPGGMLPSAERLVRAAGAAGLEARAERFFGQCYARTLLDWRERFHGAWGDIQTMPGFDQRFRRLWDYYLAYCAAGFQHGVIDVGHFRLTKPG
ncbi:SAM-dependent methyltransferase [Minwuia thermotolerans]|nr:cyclopropane-fatty-acyl-phospholipid synthase family protein [Minwuia thermotolerans]